MGRKIYVGIDNGTSGTIGWVGDNIEPGFILTPSFKEQSYTKAKNIISRIDHLALKQTFIEDIMDCYSPNDIFVVMERPRVNPKQFKTTMSAMRSLEATLCVIEDLGIAHAYCDSKDWQKVMLPKGTVGTPELKKASLDIGCRLFPQFSELIKKHTDADGILIATWAQRAGL